MNVKPLNIVVLAFALSITASTAYGSDIIAEVIKLQRAGIDNDVIVHFVQDSNSSADLSADDIQKLEDVNVSSTVIIAMLERSKELRDDPAKAHAVSAGPVNDTRLVSSPPEYDAYTEVVAPPDGQASISLFYEALTPYGTWSRDAENGWTWEPTDGARDANWRPYANNGHWTWTDHGWYWESSSPYGWATYHYGRWGYNSNHRWSWQPDNIWGPAWVDWRHSDDYIGWAPLPYGSHFEAGVGFSFHGKREGFDFHAGMEEQQYAFVASDAFLNVDLGVSFIPERRRHTVYSETKVINNTYIYNDNRIINNGVPTTMVSRATKREIQQVHVVDASIAAGQPIRGEHRDAKTIAIYRPKIADKATDEPPAILERRKSAEARKASNSQAVAERKTDRADAKENAEAARKSDQASARDKAEAEKQSRERLKAEKEKRKHASVESRQAPQQPTAANKAAEDKRNANQEAAKDRKEEVQAAKDVQVKEREEKKSEGAKTHTAAEEKRAANQVAAKERKADADAKKETKREEREDAKDAREDKAREKKDNQK